MDIARVIETQDSEESLFTFHSKNEKQLWINADISANMNYIQLKDIERRVKKQNDYSTLQSSATKKLTSRRGQSTF